MRKRFAAFAGTVQRIVRPAFWIVCAAGQWGPEYAAWDDGRVWDVLIRFALSMAFACMAVQSLRSNALRQPEPASGDRLNADVGGKVEA